MAVAMVGVFKVPGYDNWKPMFDADPVGRKENGALGHRLMRSVDDPDLVFVRVDFPSVESAQAFREKLLASDAVKSFELVQEPTVAELADEATY